MTNYYHYYYSYYYDQSRAMVEGAGAPYTKSPVTSLGRYMVTHVTVGEVLSLNSSMVR